MRPIVMTTAAMVFGMLPLALALNDGGEIQAPMGRAIIGGVITVDAADIGGGAGPRTATRRRERKPAADASAVNRQRSGWWEPRLPCRHAGRPRLKSRVAPQPQ